MEPDEKKNEKGLEKEETENKQEERTPEGLLEQKESEANGGDTVTFRRARTREQVASRKKEIVDACAVLYQKGGYGAVNLKAISEMTSITRQAIYGYFRTKEEILLELLLEEEVKWEQDMIALMSEYDEMTKDDYAMFLTSLFYDHGVMLELLALFFNVLEINCSLEKIKDFWEDSVDFYHLLLFSVKKYFPDTTHKAQRNFVSVVLAYAVGLYPMNHMSEKQIMAESMAKVSHVYPEPFDRRTAFQTQCYYGILLLLEGMQKEE